MRKLYDAVVTPMVEYALPVWYLPPRQIAGRQTKIGSVKHTKLLEKIQRQAGLLITGGLRTTSTEMLDLHANIPPIDLRLDETCHREATRLCSLPESHPLKALVKKCADYRPRYHLSPLHNLMTAYNLRPDTFETIDDVRHPLSWIPLHTSHICGDKDEAVRTILQRTDDIKIFSDGSGYRGHIGAAAMTSGLPNNVRLRHTLGKDSIHTVFEGELVGILLALHIAIGHRDRIRSVLIALDNQAAIQALNDNKRQSGQYLLDEIHTAIKKLASSAREIRVHIEWVPGHVGFQPNEDVDQEAKHAALGDHSPTVKLPPILRHRLPASVSAIRARQKERTKEKWKKRWEESRRYRKLSKIDPRLPSVRSYKNLTSWSRQATSILMQLRTGHVGLNTFLKKIKASDSPLCEVCRIPETVAHYLLHCKRYAKQRRKLRRKVGRRASSLTTLLSNIKAIEHTLRFISESKRFPRYDKIFRNSLRTDDDAADDSPI